MKGLLNLKFSYLEDCQIEQNKFDEKVEADYHFLLSQTS